MHMRSAKDIWRWDNDKNPQTFIGRYRPQTTVAAVPATFSPFALVGTIGHE